MGVAWRVQGAYGCELLFEVGKLGVAGGEFLPQALGHLVGGVGLRIGLGMQAGDAVVCVGQALLQVVGARSRPVHGCASARCRQWG